MVAFGFCLVSFLAAFASEPFSHSHLPSPLCFRRRSPGASSFRPSARHRRGTVDEQGRLLAQRHVLLGEAEEVEKREGERGQRRKAWYVLPVVYRCLPLNIRCFTMNKLFLKQNYFKKSKRNPKLQCKFNVEKSEEYQLNTLIEAAVGKIETYQNPNQAATKTW